MKISRLETHDRLKYFIEEQSKTIWRGAEDCLKTNPDSLQLQDRSPYIYIFAHPRTSDDGFTKRLLWQPRLTRPRPETNSYLFRATSHTDIMEICWLIPPREMWEQYDKGKVCESNIVLWSIDQFQHNRIGLEKRLPDDLSDKEVDDIWRGIIQNKRISKITSVALNSDI